MHAQLGSNPRGQTSPLSTCERTVHMRATSYSPQLVNNVGTNKRARVEDTADDDYHTMVRTNQDSAYFLCKRCLPLLRTSKTPSVVNVASLAGIRSSGTGVAYAMTKAAMAHMSEALACEWAGERTVTVVLTGGASAACRIGGGE